MLSGTLVLQEGKELVFWVYLEYEQKAIFIIQQRKTSLLPGQCVTVVEWVVQSGSRVLFYRLGIWSGLNLLSLEPQLVWKGYNHTHKPRSSST